MFSIAYNVVCVTNYSVPPYSLTPTYLEGVRFISQLKIILMHCVKCQGWTWVLIFLSFQLNIHIPVRMDHKCKNNPDRFCYIYGNVVLPSCKAKITDFMKKADHNYVEVKLGDQDKPFVPHICCKICVENLWDWRNGKRKSMTFQWSGGKEKITLQTAISAW